MSILNEKLAGARCLVLGFGRSNLALTKWLIKEGAEVTVADRYKTEKEILKEAEANALQNIECVGYGKSIKTDILFRSPGIHPKDSVISDALSRGAVLSSETELFISRAKGKIYGITGSDGKTTTTTITGRILEKAFENTKKRVFVGGNIGVPLISFLDDTTENDVSVAELSSFQLMTVSKSPHVSAITNISENHLDYHKSMTEYVDAKRSIFSGSGCAELVVGKKTLSLIKNEYLGEMLQPLPKKITDISPFGENADVSFKDDSVWLYGKRILMRDMITVPGFHNVENFMTAIGMTKNDALPKDVQAVAKNFRGVRHRMELVRVVSGVSYYNSSIDSTPSRSVVTLKCFDKPLTVICGGYDKQLDYSDFARELIKRADKAVLTGASAVLIKKEIEKLNAGENFRVYYEPEFSRAVLTAAEITPRGGSVLLSPASASFDGFKNFEQRGDAFAKIVNSI